MTIQADLNLKYAGACPDDPDDIAESYLLHLLPAGETEFFEEHYLACGRCTGILSVAEDYVLSMRVACLLSARPLPARGGHAPVADS